MRDIGKKRRNALIWTAAALLFTLAVCLIDVKPIGPLDSKVGFASLNGTASGSVIGVHLVWYEVSEVLGYLALATAACFAVIGLVQLIRGGFGGVERGFFPLAGLYAVLFLLYILFDKLAINYRPVLENGVLEPSYPSSHTMLAVTVFGSAILMIGRLLPSERENRFPKRLAVVLMVMTALSRLLSGYHWLTDIAGGIIISVMLLCWFAWACAALDREAARRRKQQEKQRQNEKEERARR